MTKEDVLGEVITPDDMTGDTAPFVAGRLPLGVATPEAILPPIMLLFMG